MKLFTVFLFLTSTCLFSQNDYSATKEFPFGKLNPNAPKEVADFQELIGTCNCKSESKKQDGTWTEPIDMTWTFKYIMNGMAVQDETIKADGSHSGSIRQFDVKNNTWNVFYYTTKATPRKLPAWTGNRNGNKIVLYKEQKAPNGTDGFYRLTFSNISTKGFNWIGEWVDKNEKIVFPTWKISCIKQR